MAKLLQLKITLKKIKPPIWRRILIDDTLTFADLHNIIQTLMGWFDCHLNEFTLDNGIKIQARNQFMTKEDLLDSYEEEALDASSVTLCKYLKLEGQKIIYTYDFGDNWDHIILLEAITPKQLGDRNIRCLAGKRNAPPEDSGGPYNYEETLENDDFEPEYFDLDATNRALSHHDFPQLKCLQR